MKIFNKSRGSRRLIILAGCCLLLFTLAGCDAFIRKFTRKPKKGMSQREEMVLAPQEYKPTMDKEELYRQYFLFWKSWQDELIGSLAPNANHKKQIGCTNEAIKNLMNLRVYLNQEQKKRLDIYINQLNDLKELIAKDYYGNNIVRNRQKAERIKRNILRDFSYNKVSKDLT